MEKAKLGGYRYTNFFYKKFCKPMMKWVIIGYEKIMLVVGPDEN